MRPAVPVALTTAASLLGDTLLYTALPVSAARLGVSATFVGVALSVNRFVRLLTNPLAARLYERLPAGPLVAAGIALAALTTAVYAVPAALALFLAARLAWGFSWSVLRLGSYVSAIEGSSAGTGRRLGEMRSLFGLGYLGGVVYAPLAVEALGWGTAALLAGLLTLAFGLPPALAALAWRRAVPAFAPDPPPSSPRDPAIALLSLIGAVQYALISGVLLVAGGLRVAELFPGGGVIGPWLVPATFLAGAFVLSRRLLEVFWTPLAGRLADHAASATFLASVAAGIAGLAGLALPVGAGPFLLLGGLAFLGGITSLLPVELTIARRCSDADRTGVLATYNTWGDAGAAVGALASGVLATIGAAPSLAASAAMAALTVPLWFVAHRSRSTSVGATG